MNAKLFHVELENSIFLRCQYSLIRLIDIILTEIAANYFVNIGKLIIKITW